MSLRAMASTVGASKSTVHNAVAEMTAAGSLAMDASKGMSVFRLSTVPNRLLHDCRKFSDVADTLRTRHPSAPAMNYINPLILLVSPVGFEPTTL